MDRSRSPSPAKKRSNPAAELRQRIRAGEHTSHTVGQALGHVQGNLVILPAEHADDFRRFCELNPVACPMMACSPSPGDPSLPTLGDDIDIRRDVPRYRVYRDGKLTEEVADITKLWRDDFVAFVLGCSFSFEEALQKCGVKLRYVEAGKNVAMYQTDCETTPSGPFRGKTVVSMRDLNSSNGDLRRAVEVTCRFPRVHGSPIHVGDAEGLGITDLEKPEYGDAPGVTSATMPVFWACGVTPQVAVENACLPIVITHSPGHMLVCDILNTSFEKICSPGNVPVSETLRDDALAIVDPLTDAAAFGITDALLKGDTRGMTALVEKGHVPKSACCDAARLILSRPAGVVLIATGFYIAKAQAAETDGPPGAVALGKALKRLGFTPVYVTDRYSRAAVTACAGSEDQVVVFPITSPALSADFAQGLLDGLRPTLLVSVERCGRGRDGECRNIRGERLTEYNANVDVLFELASVPSIGVADGGNEIGCGALVASGAIPGADPERLLSPPSVTKTSQLVVAACSNWGAYGIVAALALSTSKRDLLLSVADAWELVRISVEVGGAVDGILHTKGLLSVDARGEEANSACVRELHELLDQLLKKTPGISPSLSA